jgi:hypothetical protein
VAAWLRTRAGARQIVVHPAWRTDLETALAVVRRSVLGARTPEPLRRARRAARLARARGSSTPLVRPPHDAAAEKGCDVDDASWPTTKALD